jgi:hypothetical protein
MNDETTVVPWIQPPAAFMAEKPAAGKAGFSQAITIRPTTG